MSERTALFGGSERLPRAVRRKEGEGGVAGKMSRVELEEGEGRALGGGQARPQGGGEVNWRGPAKERYEGAGSRHRLTVGRRA